MPIPGITAAPLLINPGSGSPSISQIFNTSLWTGTGAARTITTGIDSGEGSLVWMKNRGSTVNHTIFDTIRGALNYLSTNLTNASTTQAGSLVGFDSSGYSLGTNSLTNTSTALYVGWQFRRAPKFFDIVQYTGDGVTGRQISHNLGVKPGMIFVKQTDAAANWAAQHISRGSQFTLLNNTFEFFTDTSIWPSSSDASNFTTGTNAVVNASGGTYVAYLFAHDPSPEGFIQCGSYVGNGSATGPVVNLGWRPQYLMIKNATGVGAWVLLDTARGLGQSAPASNGYLYANTAEAESGADKIADLRVDGFQIVNPFAQINASGQTFIYMAIREA